MKTKIIIVLLCCFCLCGCGNYRELNDLSLITGIAIDKKDDEYQISFLIANSQQAQTSSKEGESKTTVYSGTGKNLTEAVRQIEAKSPKQLYYGHVNVVIISEEVGNDGFLKIADRILRNPETRKQFYILQAKDTKAKNILKIISPLESFPSQGISSLIKASKAEQSVVPEINYSLFVSRILDQGIEAVIPSISIIGDVSDGSKEKNLETTEPDTYLKLDSIAIYRGDKFIDYTSKKESQSINILTNQVKELKWNFNFGDNLVAITSNNVKSSITVKGADKAIVDIKGNVFISEINGDYNLEKASVMKKMEKALNESIKKEVLKTTNKLQNKYKSDVIGFGNKIYKKTPDLWKKVKTDWSEKAFASLDIEVNVDFTIDSSGALEQTIKEGYNEKN